MKKLQFILLAIFSVLLLTSCKTQELKNQWKPDSLKIDGSDEDWHGVPLIIEKDLSFALGSANDTENEYLIIKTDNLQWVRRILRMGLTIYISSDDRKDKKFGIRYAGSESLVEKLRPIRTFTEQSDHPSLQERKMDKFHRPDLPEPGMIGVIQNGKFRIEQDKNPWGPAAASSENNGFFCYEFKIPLLFAKSVTDDGKTEELDKIKLGIELGGIDKEMRYAMRQNIKGIKNRMGGMRGRGMGGPGSRGGMMRHNGGAPRPDISSLEGKELWFDVILAKK